MKWEHLTPETQDAFREVLERAPKTGSGRRLNGLKRLPRINQGEEAFLFQVRVMKLPEPARNYRFLPTRKLEIDFAWPGYRIGVEIQGGTWNSGKHGRGAGIEKDMEKHNLFVDYGWRVWLFTPQQCQKGEAAQHMERVLRSLLP